MELVCAIFYYVRSFDYEKCKVCLLHICNLCMGCAYLLQSFVLCSAIYFSKISTTSNSLKALLLEFQKHYVHSVDRIKKVGIVLEMNISRTIKNQVLPSI